MSVLSGVVMDETQAVSLAELCRCCSLPAEQVVSMIEHGIVEPIESRVTISRWQFSGESVLRIQTAIRLNRDLGVNLAGVALALELLDEVKTLRQQVALSRQR
ncbi:MAG: chaperone modulator CbpM [Gammaproteobacteria bacterium]|nr:chaperone modulator CbpM [Gammaproteobacteria bacterium]